MSKTLNHAKRKPTMVGFSTSSSFPSLWLFSFAALKRRRRGAGNPPPETLGILSFEAARVMSRLCALHLALSDSEFFRRLRVRSLAACFLVSHDQLRLLRLAAAEMFLDLDSSAAFVSRLALRCRPSQSPWPSSFPRLYESLKTSSFQDRFGWPPKEAARKFKKMDGYAAGIDALYEEMEALAEMEDSELKPRRWGNHSGPLSATPPIHQRGNNVDPFRKKLAAKRSLVRRLQERSLWSVTVDKAAELMGGAVITVYAGLCSAFAAVVPELPVVEHDSRGRKRLQPRVHPNCLSGPLEEKRASAVDDIRSGPMVMSGTKVLDKEWAAKVMEPGEKTVGAAGLALRYANIVEVAERMLRVPEVVEEEAKEDLYAMLPFALREAVAARSVEIDGGKTAAEKGGEAARRVLAWLGPMAADTMRWYSERSYERRSGVAAAAEDAYARVFALQTLRYADRRKTEGAIADVLVGLSCVMRHLQRNEAEELEGNSMFCDDSS